MARRGPHPPPWQMTPDTVTRVGGGYDTDVVALFTTRLQEAEKSVRRLQADRDALLARTSDAEKARAAAAEALHAMRRKHDRAVHEKEALLTETKQKVAEWIMCVPLVRSARPYSPCRCSQLAAR